MDEKSGQEPLLRRKGDTIGCGKKKSLFVSSALWILKLSMWVIFIAWVALIFVFPSGFASDMYYKLIIMAEKNSTGVTGIVFLMFSAPVLLIAFLAAVYIALRGEEVHARKSWRFPQFRLWTFPVLVDGPFGVVSAAETLGIFVVVVYVIWAFYAGAIRNIGILPRFEMVDMSKSLVLMELTGLRFGIIGLFCMALLFLPITRGSILLRLIDIPFEHATRYHVWLGHLTMVLFTLHGLFYIIPWAIQGELTRELMEWKSTGVVVLPGVITLLAGLFMWMTSLPGVRRVNFELFFYTHQLYIVFVVGLAMHVGEFIFCFCAGAVFLFLVDRYLRFCQSRLTVDVLSARTFPCGTLELVLSKPAKLHYNALGWVFLQVRELSWLQWHPFSVSSSPLSGDNHLAIMIKVLGDWTGRLEKHISSVYGEGPRTEQQLLQPHSKMIASIEGPYGHESPYHLEYENLILVAGGIGISPFLAILSDVLHRIKDGKPCLPKNVLILWAVKKSDELPLLRTVGMESICPTFSNSLNLEIQTFVTRESGPSLEEGKAIIDPVNTACFPASRCRMSVLVGTGNILWSGLYVLASTIGFILARTLLDIWYIAPYKVDVWWYKGLLLIGCMIAGILIFGGLVISVWHLWGTKTSYHESGDAIKNGNAQQNEPNTHKDSGKEQYVNIIQYGQRPDFGVIFGSASDRWGDVDIGVIVCGPPTLQTSVAKECRRQNVRAPRGNRAVFHFNSHSFDL